jgi:PTS system mannitol-specific IIC component
VFDSGLRAPAAPGSIFAVYAQTPKDSLVGVTLSVICGAAMSFVVASLLLRMDKGDIEEEDLIAAMGVMEGMKGKKSAATAAALGVYGDTRGAGPIHSVVFACDAGMGSSAMGASVLRKKFTDAGLADVTVVNKAIANLDDGFDLVVSHQDLTDRARQKTPSALHVSVENFMASPRYDEIVELLRERNGGGSAAAAAAPPVEEAGSTAGLLDRSSVVLDGGTASKADAISRAGELLVAAGAVEPAYVDAMHVREQSVSTAMGNLLAIPHGTNEAKADVRRTAISFVRYPEGIDWNGREVKYVVGIAALGNEHLKLLARIAEVFTDQAQVQRLESAESTDDVLSVLGEVQPV